MLEKNRTNQDLQSQNQQCKSKLSLSCSLSLSLSLSVCVLSFFHIIVDDLENLKQESAQKEATNKAAIGNANLSYKWFI